MKKGLYSRLARSNIRKNYRFFIPRMLSEAGLLGCFYIALTLTMDDRLSQIKGGDYIPTLMVIGTIVLALLSTVLMFYTNSFLMKQRKREFGLYNILGMEKRHVGKVLFHESMISSLISVAAGLGFGMLFYKLCSLLICQFLQSDIVIGFYFIKATTLIPSALFFILLDLITYFFNRISIARMKPVDLLASRSAGEKEPKIKWPLLVLGLASLGAGYYLAITTVNPLQALEIFFLAVILVIIGTYFLFVSLSIFILKALRRNKRYYYTAKHMPAVSGLLYRMKQNAVGLASIAILATGVLVMISTTVSLYSGLQGTLDKNYPQHLYLEASASMDDGTREHIEPEKLEGFVRDAADSCNVKIKSIEINEYLSASYYVQDHTLYAENEFSASVQDVLNGLCNFIFIPERVYSDLTGESLGLSGNSIALCRISTPVNNLSMLDGTLTLHGCQYKVDRYVPYFPIDSQFLDSAFTTYGVIVSDDAVLEEIYQNHRTALGENASDYTRRIGVTFCDINDACEHGQELTKAIQSALRDYIEKNTVDAGSYGYKLDTYWEAKTSLIGMYGTLLFLGILLGSVCVFATVLIIYYKQISEGYEDRDRFQIMEKIGMSDAEVNTTIRSQVLLVFFLPLITAGIHYIFAYPLLTRLLKVLMLYKSTLLLVCSLITYAVFAAVYVLIYSATSRTYYKIVH